MQASRAGEAPEVRVVTGRGVGWPSGEGGVGAKRRGVGAMSKERDQRRKRGVAGVVGGVAAHAERRRDERAGCRSAGAAERGDGEGGA